MSRPPNSRPALSHFWARFLSRTSLSIGAVLLLGLLGGAVWAWVWIHEQLAPLVANNLQRSLGRPVELGDVQQVSFTQVQFGKSAIPATPTDSDRITAEAIEVDFSPLQLLLNRRLQLNVTLVQPDVFVEQAKDGRWVTTQLTQQGSGVIITDLQSIQVRDGQLTLLPVDRPNLARLPVQVDDVEGTVRLLDQNQRIRFNIKGQSSGGWIDLAGVSRPAAEQTILTVQGQNLPVIALSRLVTLPVTLQSGRATGRVRVQFQAAQTPELFGLVSLQDVTAQIANLPQRFANTTGQLRFQGSAIAFDGVKTRYGQIPVQIAGNINTKQGYNLSGTIPAIAASTALNTFKVSSPIAIAGTVQAKLQVKGNLQNPELTGTVNTINQARVDRIAFNSIQSQFRLTTDGNAPLIRFSNLQANPVAGGTITGNGQAQLAQQRQITATIRANNVPGDAIAQVYNLAPNIQIGNADAIAQVSGTLNRPTTNIQFQVPQATYPGSGRVILAGNRIRLQDGVFQVAGGTVQATGQVINQQFQARVNTNQVRLAQFAPALRGNLNADLQIRGRTDALQLANLQAQGQVRFSEGLAVIDSPLTAQVRWNGQQIQVLQASAPGLSANGTVAVDLTGTPQIQGLDLAVQAQDYALQELGVNLPQNIALNGTVDFDGRVTGTVNAPSAVGNLRLQNLRVNQAAFDPVLTGTLNYQARQQTQLQLSGIQDQIALTLNANNQPTGFLVQRNQAVARGRAVGETLSVELQAFPVARLQQLLPNATTAQQVAGLVSGTVSVDLENQSAVGNIAIANPRLGRISGDTFRGQFQFSDGVATIKGGELRQGETRIALDGNVQVAQAPVVNLQVRFDQTNVQELLQALNTFGLQDLTAGLQAPTLGNAADLRTKPIELSDNTLQTQLERFNQIRSQVAQQTAQKQVEPLPTLSELQGTVTGSIAISSSQQAGLNAQFNLSGQNWVWGQYTIPTVTAIGQYANGSINFSPLRIDLGQATLALNGEFGTEQASGQVQARNLAIAQLQPFFPQLPDQIAGTLNATATIAGNFNDPNVTGTVALTNATVNNQPIQQAQTNFQYNDARLAFSSNALLTGTDPLQVSGSIPLTLPFVTAQPTSNQINLNARIQNSGLAIVNLFTDQVNWAGGQGQLSVDVTGTLNRPVINGRLSLQDATVRSQFLPQPLTRVTGNVVFDRDRISVVQLQGRYQQNQLTAQGVLPIFAATPVESPLTVNLNNLDLNLAGLYQGELSGAVNIRGTALTPQVGGAIQLANGQIILNELLNQSNQQTTGQPVRSPIATPTPNLTVSPTAAARFPIRFDNLQVTLGDNVQVVQQPLFNFTLAGGVALNGSLARPRPVGVVRLERGQINLFTTQFTLERNEEQTIRFTPEQGLDPILDIQLVALVPESTGSRLPSRTSPSEIRDLPASFGRLRTVRVEASIEGRASELNRNLELTSDPTRSRAEILSLVGGSFVNALGQGDPTLGIATITGSALFGNFQGSITQFGQAIGLDELRIYPTIVTSPTSDESVLGVATEGIIDITNSLSFSVSALFATDEPLRYGVLYRLSDDLLVRSSTDLSGENRVLIEYENRF